MGKRGPKASLRAYDTLSIRIDPHLGRELDMWAHRARVSRSELGRYVFTEALARIRRRGRRWLKEQIEGRNAAQEEMGEVDAASRQRAATNGTLADYAEGDDDNGTT